MSRDAIKKAVGYKAAELVQDGMLVGLGTGSTAFYFIEKLILRCREGLKIQAIASSSHSYMQAQKGNIPLLDPDQVTSLDLTVDGADEIDPQNRMIKGGGGAHVREKIVASMSKEMVVIVDESKCVDLLGRCKLPVEVIPFASHATHQKILKLGYHGEFRLQRDGSIFMSDNGNHIIDIHFSTPRLHPEEDHEALMHIPGVIDTGFFFHLATKVIVGFFDGQIVVRS